MSNYEPDIVALQFELSEKNILIQNLYNDLDDMRDACDDAKNLTKTFDHLQSENNNLKSELEECAREIEKLRKKNIKLETYVNSSYKLITNNSVSNDSVSNDSISNDSIDIDNSSNDSFETNITQYELIPHEIVAEWLIDYINNACTYTSMNTHTLSYERVKPNGELKTYKRVFKNTKWTLRIMLKQHFSYFHPKFCKRIYASKDIQNTQCMICYNDVDNPCILTCKCKYIYCYRCINKWINKQKNNCPCCNSKTVLIEAGPLTPMHLKSIIDRQESLSSVPQHLKIFE